MLLHHGLAGILKSPPCISCTSCSLYSVGQVFLSCFRNPSLKLGGGFLLTTGNIQISHSQVRWVTGPVTGCELGFSQCYSSLVVPDTPGTSVYIWKRKAKRAIGLEKLRSFFLGPPQCHLGVCVWFFTQGLFQMWDISIHVRNVCTECMCMQLESFCDYTGKYCLGSNLQKWGQSKIGIVPLHLFGQSTVPKMGTRLQLLLDLCPALYCGTNWAL